MDFTAREQGLNRSTGAIQGDDTPNSHTIDVKTILQDIPPEIWERLEPWERELTKIIQRVQKSTGEMIP